MSDVAPEPDSAPSEALDEAVVRHWVEHDPSGADRTLRRITGLVWKLGFRHRATGAQNVPVDGAFLLVPNHSSYLDPFLHVYGQSRIVRFMAKSSLFEIPGLRSFVRAGGGFPVRRGRGDTLAMEIARRVLADGQALVVYPEGTRFRKSLPLGPARSGAARLALESGVPVVPVATWGNKERELYGRPRWRRPRVTVVYGEPMSFPGVEPTRENVARVRDEIWEQVERLYARARELDAAREHGG